MICRARGRPGKAGALMAGREIRESVAVAGRAERARVARAFAVGVFGPGYPYGDDACAVSKPCAWLDLLVYDRRSC